MSRSTIRDYRSPRGRDRLHRSLRGTLALIGGLAIMIPMTTAAAPASGQEVDTVFTIVQVPDTQNEVTVDTPLMTDRYQWIADNRVKEDLRFVVHTGDVVNWGVVEPVQFTRARAATNILDASGIPYAYAIGNHDGAAVAVGGSAGPGDVYANLRNTALFNTTFPLSSFKNVGGAFEAGKVDNMFQTFTAGGKDWMVLTLEMWPRSEAIEWAKGVVAAHPRHNVIINTHANINRDAQWQTVDIYGSNSAQVLWERLGSQYPNIRMVLSGHYGARDWVGSAAYRETTGQHGNKVLHVMTAYTSPFQNHTRLLTVDTAAMSVSSSVFVNKSINKAYPAGKVTDQASDFTVRGMDFLAGGNVGSAPGAPENLKVAPGSGSATVSFRAPASDGGSPITSYTVTANPGGATVTSTDRLVTVPGLTNGTKYTLTVRATNKSGTGPASAPSPVVLPSASRELLSDPGFETGNGKWVPFVVGDHQRVTSPVHGGSHAMRITTTGTAPNLTGMMQNLTVTNSAGGYAYTARCWVRPTKPGVEVRFQLLEYTQDWTKNIKIATTISKDLPANTWTLVSATGHSTAAGKRIIPQIYAPFQTASTGAVFYDDCSFS